MSDATAEPRCDAIRAWDAVILATRVIRRRAGASRALVLGASAALFLVFSVVCAATATTVERRPVASSDDAEQMANASVRTNSSDLELIHDSSDQTVGIRWTALAIPRGATITAAYIQFSAEEAQSEATDLTLHGQASDNAGTFASAKLNISSRPRVAASVSWAPAAWTAGGSGADQRTPDLSAMIQEIVSRPGWASGNALVVVVTGTGHRTAWAYDGSASLAPLLHIEFSGAPPTDDPPVARLSVTQAATPPLTVSADGSASTDTDLTPIAGYRFDFGDGTVPLTTTAPTATAQHTYATAGTYTVTLTATDTGSLTSTPTSASITVNPPATGGTTVERRIAASSDDAEEFPTGSMYLTSSDLELTYDGSTQTIGMRWAALAIPRGAAITSAHIQFSAKASQSAVTSLSIRGHAADHAPTFGSGTGDISTRSRTAAAASWAPGAWTTGGAGANQRTPDLSAVLQEIVSRAGWSSGNALALIVTGTGSRTAWAYDGNPSAAPLLHIEFGGGAPGNQAPNGTIDGPAAAVTITPGQSVSFQGTGSDPDGNLPLGFLWDLGGGAANRTVEDPGAVTFSTPGTFTVRFVVTDALGLADPTPDTRSITVSGPTTPVADEVHWTIMGQTAVSFDWRGGSDTIRFGTTTAYGRTVIAAVPNPLPISSAGPFREARLAGLDENTLYHYSIGTGPDHTFRTPPPRGASGFTVYAEGDIGNATNWPRMGVIQSMIAAGQPNFVLALGDLSYASPGGQALVDRHFNDVMAWSQDAAYMPIWGNHEWTSPADDDLRNYKGRFDLPNPRTSPGSPAVSCCGEDWYWFDYGNVRFIGYPEEWSGAWSDWRTQATPLMAEAQNDPAIRFIVTFGHKPAYSSGYHNGSSSLRAILDTLGVRHGKYVLNLNGHSHNYERSHPQFGVTHVTSGTGGTNLEEVGLPCLWAQGCPPPAWSAYRAMHHVALKLRFTATGIEGTVYCGPAGDTGSNENDISCAQGTVLESFTITGSSLPPVASALEAATAPAESPSTANAAVTDSTARMEDGVPPRRGDDIAWVHPMPLRGSGALHFVNPRLGHVSITMFDIRGRIVRELMERRTLAAGAHTVDLDGRDAHGDALPSGVYLYQVSLQGRVIAGKLLIVR